MILAWVYDVTTQGIRATRAVATPAAYRRRNLTLLIASGVIVSAALPHVATKRSFQAAFEFKVPATLKSGGNAAVHIGWPTGG